MEILFCGYTGQPPAYEWYLIDADLSKKQVTDTSPLIPLFIPESTLHEETIPNCPYQRTTYLPIYSKKSPYHAVLASHLYSFGGRVLSDKKNNRSTEVWALDLTNPRQCWSRCPTMTHPRCDPAAVVLDGKIYVFGGCSSYLLGCCWMEVFDPVLKGWKPLPDPPDINLAGRISIAPLESRKEILVTSWKLFGNSFALYIYNTTNCSWKRIAASVTPNPPPHSTRVVVVDSTLYWARLDECRVSIQAYDFARDVWFYGLVDTHLIYAKHEHTFDRRPSHPHFLHVRDQKFCLLINSCHVEGMRSKESKTYYLDCLMLDVSTIYKEEKWELSISILSFCKYSTGHYCLNLLDTLKLDGGVHKLKEFNQYYDSSVKLCNQDQDLNPKLSNEASVTSKENCDSGLLREEFAMKMRIEHSAVNLAESVKHGGLPAPGSVAPSILEAGKTFTEGGMQVHELVPKESIDLLITETGEDQLYKEARFDQCFYKYGGQKELKVLKALSNHDAKAKLSSEQRPVFDEKLKQVQEIFSMRTEMDGSGVETDKGKKVETRAKGSDDEMKKFHDSSVSKAADMAAGFTSALAGATVNDMIQRTADRIESLHSEGVLELSKMCCFAVSQLLMLGKSIISNASKVQDEDGDEDSAGIDWPEDSFEKAKIIRTKVQSMTGYVEAVSNSFITGIFDVTEAYEEAIKVATAESLEVIPQTSIQEIANARSEHLRADQIIAVGKIQDALQFLSYVVLSTSMPCA